MTSQNAAGGDRAAELRAAVRAVESGERPADSFFTERAPKPGRAAGPPAGGGAARGAEPEASGPVPVPEELQELVAAAGAPAAAAVRLVELLGPEAAGTLRADPWRLLAAGPAAGVRPEQADALARAVPGPAGEAGSGAEHGTGGGSGAGGEGGGAGDARRAEALLVWLLERAALAGHTALEPAALSGELARYGVPDPDGAVREAIDSGTVLVFEEELDGPESGAGHGRQAPGPRETPAGAPGEEPEAGEGAERPVRLLVGLERYALAEESLADGLARLLGTCTPVDAERTGGGAAGAPPASAGPAAELVRAAAGHGVVVHTGGEAARTEPAA
ncbi:hypothetical protein HOY81_09045, partial [Streptomyces sp. JJ36]|nr:hypothetical protein [Streptomyces sp. JJ36]